MSLPPFTSWSKAAHWKLKSSAVAMPAFAMAKVTLISIESQWLRKKKWSSDYNQLQRQAGNSLI